MILTLFFLSISSMAAPESIYGEDNRIDVYQEESSTLRKLALSTAAMIDNSNFQREGNNVIIGGRSFGEMYSLCKDEKFRFQPIAANCSGTLISPDVILTAAHCYDLAHESCSSYSWVFDYKVYKERQPIVKIDSSKVYKCEEVLFRQLGGGLDHALIRLDRSVSDRPYVKMRKRGELEKNDELILIGHPRGLPTKIAAGGRVLSKNKFEYVTNLDAFTINSGSGVFNARTLELEGILTAGSKDFDMENGCTYSRVMSMDEGQEKVARIEVVSEVLKSLGESK